MFTWTEIALEPEWTTADNRKISRLSDQDKKTKNEPRRCRRLGATLWIQQRQQCCPQVWRLPLSRVLSGVLTNGALAIVDEYVRDHPFSFESTKSSELRLAGDKSKTRERGTMRSSRCDSARFLWHVFPPTSHDLCLIFLPVCGDVGCFFHSAKDSSSCEIPLNPSSRKKLWRSSCPRSSRTPWRGRMRSSSRRSITWVSKRRTRSRANTFDQSAVVPSTIQSPVPQDSAEHEAWIRQRSDRQRSISLTNTRRDSWGAVHRQEINVPDMLQKSSPTAQTVHP